MCKVRGKTVLVCSLAGRPSQIRENKEYFIFYFFRPLASPSLYREIRNTSAWTVCLPLASALIQLNWVLLPISWAGLVSSLQTWSRGTQSGPGAVCLDRVRRREGGPVEFNEGSGQARGWGWDGFNEYQGGDTTHWMVETLNLGLTLVSPQCGLNWKQRRPLYLVSGKRKASYF